MLLNALMSSATKNENRKLQRASTVNIDTLTIVVCGSGEVGASCVWKVVVYDRLRDRLDLDLAKTLAEGGLTNHIY